MLTGPHVLLALKIAVAAVTILLLASLTALLLNRPRLHGRINMVFFSLTILALVVFEGVTHIVDPDLFNYFDDGMRERLNIHLCFSVPSALLLPFMLFTGVRYYRRIHLGLSMLFGMLWTGTFITGIFFLQ